MLVVRAWLAAGRLDAVVIDANHPWAIAIAASQLPALRGAVVTHTSTVRRTS
jgi:precorrin-6x reductase